MGGLKGLGAGSRGGLKGMLKGQDQGPCLRAGAPFFNFLKVFFKML